jgi:hypothetical protein
LKCRSSRGRNGQPNRLQTIPKRHAWINPDASCNWWDLLGRPAPTDDSPSRASTSTDSSLRTWLRRYTRLLDSRVLDTVPGWPLRHLGLSILDQGGWLGYFVVTSLNDGGLSEFLRGPRLPIIWWVVATTGSVTAPFMEKEQIINDN